MAETAERLDSDLDALRADIRQMRADFTKLTESLQNVAHAGGTEALDKLRQSTQRVKDEAKRTGQSVIDEIEERPVAAAVAAFIAGIVLAMLLGRRS